jgi:hypothetical protein
MNFHKFVEVFRNRRNFFIFPINHLKSNNNNFIKHHKSYFSYKNDRNFTIKEYDNKEHSTPSKNTLYNRYNFTEEMIENCSVRDLIEIARILIETENKNLETWNNILHKFNSLLCEHSVNKEECIEFIQILNHFQPKVLEKKLPPKNNHTGSINLFSKRHEEEYFKLRKPKDVLFGFSLFIKNNLRANVIRHLIEETIKLPHQDGLNTDIEEVINTYNILFDNIELKVVDDIRNGRAEYTYEECIKLIQSFSRAEEGTNMLYELLMRKISSNTKDLTLNHIEILMNYLPHSLYNEDPLVVEEELEKAKDEKFVELGKTLKIDKFYNECFSIICNNIGNCDDKLFINIFQGAIKTNFVGIDTINTFLVQFEYRIIKSEKDKKFFFDFLQILAYFIKANPGKLENFDVPYIFKAIETVFINRFKSVFNLKEISTIFWIFHHLKYVDKRFVENFEGEIKKILLSYINDPKVNIETMGYESSKRYYDQYDIERYDLEALNYFIKSSDYKGNLFEIINNALNCVKLENTHPISRKWFFF